MNTKSPESSKDKKEPEKPMKLSFLRWINLLALLFLLGVNGIIMAKNHELQATIQENLTEYNRISSKPTRNETDKLIDELNKYRANEVGPYHLVLDIKGNEWSEISDALEDARLNAFMVGPNAFAEYRYYHRDQKGYRGSDSQPTATAKFSSATRAQADRDAEEEKREKDYENTIRQNDRSAYCIGPDCHSMGWGQ
jgi:hypothetical protein